MKKFNRDYTTPEQSKRLLELGLPIDSANYYCVVKNNYYAVIGEDNVYSSIEQEIIEVNKRPYHDEIKRGEDILPAWSVGRLIEIWKICNGKAWYYYTDSALIDEIVEDFGIFDMDFSKLEE